MPSVWMARTHVGEEELDITLVEGGLLHVVVQVKVTQLHEQYHVTISHLQK